MGPGPLLWCHLSPLKKDRAFCSDHKIVQGQGWAVGTGGGERNWKGTLKPAPFPLYPGALSPSPLCWGSSFCVYAVPTNQPTHLHLRGHVHIHGLLDMSGAWTFCGRGMGQGSSWRPRLCWGEVRRPPQLSPGLCREGILDALRPGREFGGLCLEDSGVPLGMTEQGMTFLCCSVHFVSTPLFSQGCFLSLFLQRQ